MGGLFIQQGLLLALALALGPRARPRIEKWTWILLQIPISFAVATLLPFEGELGAVEGAPAAVLLVLVAPVCEEWLFRGSFYAMLAPTSRALAVVAPGLVFGLLHGRDGWGLAALILGLGLGLIRDRGGLGASILAHAMNNLLFLLLSR